MTFWTPLNPDSTLCHTQYGDGTMPIRAQAEVRIGVRRSHAPYPGLCGAVAAPASSIPALAGLGTVRLQLRRLAPERYDLHLQSRRLESPRCFPPDHGLIPRPILALSYPSPRPSPLLTPSLPWLTIPMNRMDPFTWPAEFPSLSPISLCAGSALAEMGRCPFCSGCLVCFTL